MSILERVLDMLQREENRRWQDGTEKEGQTEESDMTAVHC